MTIRSVRYCERLPIDSAKALDALKASTLLTKGALLDRGLRLLQRTPAPTWRLTRAQRSQECVKVQAKIPSETHDRLWAMKRVTRKRFWELGTLAIAMLQDDEELAERAALLKDMGGVTR